MIDSAPVIILGAPRSGTSLVQDIVRSCPGFVSPARESQHIWAKHVHPSLNDWDYEGVPAERLSTVDTDALREELYRQAISNQLWRLLRRLGIYDSPRLMALARVAGKPLISVLGGLNRLLSSRENQDNGARFVDKSVHGALWIELILRVFPGCRIIHITRDPFLAIPSMVEAWKEPKRFRSFAVPADNGELAWCFGLVPGWRELLEEPLDIRCARQWLIINERVLAHAESLRQSGRYLQLQLESLAGAPDQAIPELRKFIGCEASPYWRSLESEVPVVNPGRGTGHKKQLSKEARALLATMRERMGYA